MNKATIATAVVTVSVGVYLWPSKQELRIKNFKIGKLKHDYSDAIDTFFQMKFKYGEKWASKFEINKNDPENDFIKNGFKARRIGKNYWNVKK